MSANNNNSSDKKEKKTFWQKVEDKLNNMPTWVREWLEAFNESDDVKFNGGGYGGC